MSPEIQKAIYPAFIGIALICMLIAVWRGGKRKADKAWIAGFREGTHDVSFGVSQYYEHDGLPIPADVEAAIVMMEKAEKRENMYAIKMGLGGAAIEFGRTMGKAAQLRGRELEAERLRTGADR
jgi:hypothetical protein